MWVSSRQKSLGLAPSPCQCVTLFFLSQSHVSKGPVQAHLLPAFAICMRPCLRSGPRSGSRMEDRSRGTLCSPEGLFFDTHGPAPLGLSCASWAPFPAPSPPPVPGRGWSPKQSRALVAGVKAGPSCHLSCIIQVQGTSAPKIFQLTFPASIPEQVGSEKGMK